MPRGRPAKPVPLKKLEGNPGKRPIKDTPQPDTSIPTCPAWLDATAKTEWSRISALLAELDLVALIDRAALAAYCQAVAELQYATELLRAEGRVLDEPIVAVIKKRGRRKKDAPLPEPEVVGYKKKLHPAVKLQRDAFARVKSFLTEFGLSPSSRARLSIEPADGGDDEIAVRKRG